MDGRVVKRNPFEVTTKKRRGRRRSGGEKFPGSPKGVDSQACGCPHHSAVVCVSIEMLSDALEQSSGERQTRELGSLTIPLFDRAKQTLEDGHSTPVQFETPFDVRGANAREIVVQSADRHVHGLPC